MANPAIDLGFLTMQDLEDGFSSPNRDSWLRTDLNMWTASVGSWLPHGTFENLVVDDQMPDGGILAVDSDADGAGYVGVRAAKRDDGRIQVRAEFRLDSLDELWTTIRTLLEDRKIVLDLTPGLHSLCPNDLQKRSEKWGQREITIYTSVVRGLIIEGKVVHSGQMSLVEHVARAVAGRSTGATIALTSTRSPGPIELARCMVDAVGRAAAAAPTQRPGLIVHKT